MSKRPPSQQQQSRDENVKVEDKSRGHESEPDDGVTWKVLPRTCIARMSPAHDYNANPVFSILLRTSRTYSAWYRLRIQTILDMHARRSRESSGCGNGSACSSTRVHFRRSGRSLGNRFTTRVLEC